MPEHRPHEAAAPRNDGVEHAVGMQALSERERSDLRSAMGRFECCQQWSLCEVIAPSV